MDGYYIYYTFRLMCVAPLELSEARRSRCSRIMRAVPM